MLGEIYKFTNVLTLSSNGRMVTSSNLQRTGGTVNLSAGGILIDNSGIYGASAQNTTEFYILANDGKAYFGGGNGIIDKGGITIGGSGATGFLSLKEQDNSSEYRMYNSNGASLTIFNNDKFLFMNNTHIGGNHITKDISKILKIDYRIAEAKKIKFSNENKVNEELKNITTEDKKN